MWAIKRRAKREEEKKHKKAQREKKKEEKLQKKAAQKAKVDPDAPKPLPKDREKRADMLRRRVTALLGCRPAPYCNYAWSVKDYRVGWKKFSHSPMPYAWMTPEEKKEQEQYGDEGKYYEDVSSGTPT